MNPHRTFRKDTSLRGNEHSILSKSDRRECYVAELSQEPSVSLQFSWGRRVLLLLSATQSCPTLCDPMDCNMPGFPVLHQLLEFTENSHPLRR